MNLIYLSPVPWKSYAQRPHKFVEWFHKKTDGKVLWVEPYPTRIPRISDFLNLKSRINDLRFEQPKWLSICKPYALPIEPFSVVSNINNLLWFEKIKKIKKSACGEKTLLVIGKPSALSIKILDEVDNCKSIYDAMDDFPAFYTGLSKASQLKNEKRIVDKVACIFASSTALEAKWRDAHENICLVKNGLDIEKLPLIKKSSTSFKKVFGYVGAMGSWFDWSWISYLSINRPADEFHLVGPVHCKPNLKLPFNVKFFPECNHRGALEFMAHFDVGLIPFKLNPLTMAVDPIKYYEYKALGLPVISSSFGEMRYRQKENGVFIANSVNDLSRLADSALNFKCNKNELDTFISQNSWEYRFDKEFPADFLN